jgi:hypothetical protein
MCDRLDGVRDGVYRRWFDAKYGREMSEATWLKAHAAVGTMTGIVTAITVTASNSNDSPELPGLVETTARRFDLAEVSADKAYLGHDNLAAIEAVGAVPYIPFKTNSRDRGSPAWRRMWAVFMYRQEEFLAHYHSARTSRALSRPSRGNSAVPFDPRGSRRR